MEDITSNDPPGASYTQVEVVDALLLEFRHARPPTYHPDGSQTVRIAGCDGWRCEIEVGADGQISAQSCVNFGPRIVGEPTSNQVLDWVKRRLRST